MASFAKIGINGKVLDVLTVSDVNCLGSDGVENEEIGRQYLENVHGWPLWKKTSLNTKNGKHWTYNENGELIESADQSKAFRGNFARIGGTYDDENEIFWNPKPYPSWIKDETIYQWKPPVNFPSINSYTVDGISKEYNIYWDEENNRWLGKHRDDETQVSIWNEITKSWSSL